MPPRLVAIGAILCLLPFATGSADAGPRGERIDRAVQEALASGPEGTVLTVWAGFADGRELYAREADRPMPVASAIKAPILLELYASFDGEIDEALEEVEGVVNSTEEPAFAHYRKSSRNDVCKALAGSTVDEIGRIMIGTTEAPNLVYNGAANVAIGVLGGPAAATRAMRARDPAFAGLTLNRYMLADRTERGDNTATAAALAAVHRRLATRDLPGLDRATIDRVRDVLAKGNRKRQLYSKGGSLRSDPLTRVRAGWREGPKRSLVWVVMGSAPQTSAVEPATAHKGLTASVASLWEAIDAAYESSL